MSESDQVIKNLPMIPKEYQKEYRIVKQKKPGEEELQKNNRARSAKLRVIERIEG